MAVSSSSNTAAVVINICDIAWNKIERVSKDESFREIFNNLSYKYPLLES